MRILSFATAYDNAKTTVQKIMGSVIADRCKDVQDPDGERELNAVSI